MPACNRSISEAEAGGSQFKNRLGYTAKPGLMKTDGQITRLNFENIRLDRIR